MGDQITLRSGQVYKERGGYYWQTDKPYWINILILLILVDL